MKKLGVPALILLIFAAPAVAGTEIGRKVSLGGKLTTGNTQLQSVNFEFGFSRNRKLVDETSLKGRFDREFSAGAETLFKIYSALRYARSVNERFYNFYKMEVGHDRFQDINLRLIPTAGLGYWFMTEADYKSMVEIAAGYQQEYLFSRATEGLIVLTLSSNLDRGPFSNDLDIYLAANDFGNFRFTNLAHLRAKLNSYFAFKLTVKDEFNNRPAVGVDKNDLSITTALEYSFKETRP